MIFTPPKDKKIARVIDANLDRAREGLRVIEDWCRFGIDRKDLVVKLKNWRHQLALHHHEIYKLARSASTDQGALLNHPAQKTRQTSNEIVFANCSRVQEALRVLEEFSRQSDPDLAKIAAIIRFEIYEFELTVFKANRKNIRINLLNTCNLCLITTPTKDLISIVSSALSAGIKMVQYRCKSSNDQIKISEVLQLASICKDNGALFIINDRVDFALAADADGVHLGQNDIPIEIARKILGEERLIGRSTHNLNQLQRAKDEGCDYIGAGPVFPTKNKPQETISGLEFLREAYNATKLPCFAIGGINISNISEIRKSGFNRIAVIDAIMNSKEPGQATKELLKKLL
tara:strand:- start:11099 stop:12136 length:1038 start_codon:yes stop_codon:yes gene_type:complete